MKGIKKAAALKYEENFNGSNGYWQEWDGTYIDVNIIEKAKDRNDVPIDL